MIANSTTRLDRRRPAYTLLEVLIAGVLITVMMVAVWSLLRTWSGLYDRGQSRAQLSQLVRSLTDQLTEDIQSAVVPTDRPSRGRPSSGTTAPTTAEPDLDAQVDDLAGVGSDSLALPSEVSSFEVREVALVGGQDWLVLDVVRSPSPWNRGELDEDPDLQPQRELEPQVYVPDLQRVIYTFVGGGEADPLIDDTAWEPTLDQTEAVPGLLRLAMAREFVGQMDESEGIGFAGSGGTSLKTKIFELRERLLLGDDLDLSSAISSEEPQEAEVFVLPESETASDQLVGVQGILEQDFVPEVSWLEFRYFDGSSWSDSWDSAGGRGLPVAVEIRFNVDEVEPAAEVESTEEGLPTAEDELLPLADATADSTADDLAPWTEDRALDQPQTEETPYHRCIVMLGLAQPPRSASPLEAMGDVLP